MENITTVNKKVYKNIKLKTNTVKMIKYVTFYTMLFEIAFLLLCTLLYAYYTLYFVTV